jgi:hypothetical protein
VEISVERALRLEPRGPSSRVLNERLGFVTRWQPVLVALKRAYAPHL